jgi:uncharacterized protein YkwD
VRRRIPVAALCVAAAPAGPVIAPAAAAPSSCAHAQAAAGSLGAGAAAETLRCLINAERARRGLRPVRGDTRLRRAAGRHARDMATHGYFAHVARDGSSPAARVRRTGYLRGARSWSVGEALAWGRDAGAAPRRLVARLLRSPSHRAIILNPAFREVGVGVALGAPDHQGGGPALTVALDFARRGRRPG